ncbi:phosphoadenosine phosphosulfate reductase family protein [Candidatus Bathyarchaeota archaeon]|nr:phosphoadenosine phosphosulfate reductase family protein [Candidatus Bathyarchaeota archaeon]
MFREYDLAITMNKEKTALAQLAEISHEKVAVSFSGGKDSLVALDLAYRVGIRKAVFCDTSVEFDETREFVKHVEKFYGMHIDVVRAPVTFFEIIKHVGLPSRVLRWCCDVFKFGPLSNYAVQESLHSFITGLRMKESSKRASYENSDRNPLVPVIQTNPILTWTDQDVWEYTSENRLPVNPLYEHFKRIGCWCCPFKTDNDWEKIKELFPEKASFFEGILADYANRMDIRDKETFIQKRGWKMWSNSVSKISVGLYSPCQTQRDKVDLIFSGQSKNQIDRIIRLLPILTDDYFLVGNKLRITIKDIDKRRLNVLVEKAINCKACGACTSLCRTGGLKVDQGSVYVDFARCNKCQDCLRTHPLRGACIIRNYSPKVATLVNS